MKEWIEERAAIMEYDGHKPRVEAEREAKRLWVAYKKEQESEKERKK